MFKRLNFYLRHSLTDLRVNGQRTFFALLCIAAGVAAIVSLQTLAVMIQTTLTDNLQESNRGDVVYRTGGMRVTTADATLEGVEAGILGEDSTNFLGMESTAYYFTLDGYKQMAEWLDETYPAQITLTYRQRLSDEIGQFFGTGRGTTVTDPATGNSSAQASAILIDPEVYPFYGEVIAEDGRRLSELITAPEHIVLGDQIARNIGADVGSTVLLNGSDTPFTVTGIVDAGQEIKNVGQDALLGIFGFYYLSNEAIELFDDPTTRISMIYMRLADPTRLDEIDTAFQTEYPFFLSTDTEDLRRNYTALSDSIDQLVTVMGLVSLLIGSIGIVNTMQVIVRRRTLEVGVLKTLGLQANQITLLFMTEALIMGVVGSLAGIVLGWAATFVIRGAAEQVFATELPFVLAFEPAITGFVIGVIVTLVFGFLPTLTAGLVRPNVVLRPTETFIPRAGIFRVLLVLILIIVVMALVTQGILGGFRNAITVVGAAFFIAGIFYVMLSVLIWVIGRFFPSLGIVDLKLSLRQMLAGRSRAAVTLLALVIGVFSLSLITLMAESINNLLRFALTEASGGNVAIFASSPNQINQIETILNGVDGVESYAVSRAYTLTLTGMREGETVLSPDDIRARLNANRDEIFPFGGPRVQETTVGEDGEVTVTELPEERGPDLFQLFSSQLGGVDARDLDQLPQRNFTAGRQLNANDAGQPVMVVTENAFTKAAGLNVGDVLLFRLGEAGAPNAETFEFEVVGLTQESLTGGGFDGQNYAPVDAFPEGSAPNRVTVMVNVVEEQLPALRRELAAVRGAFVLETAVITKLVEALLGTFIAFPTMVALLGLVVGGVVIANSVALTTMERRREIAIMKSVGLQRERVLLMILLENGILGFIGGLIGVGIGLLGLLIIMSTGSIPSSTIPFGTAFILMMICVGVALVAALTSAWSASGEKPLNVLRYE